MTAVLSLSNIQVFYDRAIEAVRDISIDVTEGAIVALLGSNGAGKSTVLKAISGVLEREENLVRVVDPDKTQATAKTRGELAD